MKRQRRKAHLSRKLWITLSVALIVALAIGGAALAEQLGEMSSNQTKAAVTKDVTTGAEADKKIEQNEKNDNIKAQKTEATKTEAEAKDEKGKTAQAKEDTPTAFFTIKDGVITGYAENGPKNVVIPANIGGTPVTGIGANAFSGLSLSSVVIPSGVKSIGVSAFENNALTSVTIPDTVTDIKMNAFQNNKLTTLSIPAGVETIGEYAFQNNELASVSLPSTLTSCKEYAFKNNKLVSVALPSGLTEIADYLFENNNLTNVTFASGTTSIGMRAFAGNTGLAVNLNSLSSLTNIGDGAFNGCAGSWGNVVIPTSVNEIGGSAFKGTGITNFDISNRYKGEINGDPWGLDSSCTIKYKELDSCWDFTPTNGKLRGLKPAGHDGCTDPSIHTSTTLTIPAQIAGKDVLSIEEGAFEDGIYTHITIPGTVTSIKHEAFSGCNNLESLNIPASVTELGTYCFSNATKLTSLTFESGSSLTAIPTGCFSGAQLLTSVTLPEGIITVADYAFQKTGLTEIHLPSTLSDDNETGSNALNSSAFSGCEDLEDVYISKEKDSITGAPWGAKTWGCNHINTTGKNMTVHWNNSETTNFDDVTVCDGTWHFDIASKTLTTYYGTGGNVTIPSTITSGGNTYNVENLGKGLFRGKTEVTGVTIPEGIKVIQDQAFKGTNIETLTFPSTLTAINSSSGSMVETFEGCTKLKSVDFGSSKLTVIPGNAFKGCTQLTSIKIPEGVTAINEGAFSGCTGLKTLDVSGNTTLMRVGTEAFLGADITGDLVFPSTLIQIDSSAFKDNGNLTSIDISNATRLNKLAAGAFSGCTKLAGEIIINSTNTPNLGSEVFKGTQITSVSLPKDTSSIDSNAFLGMDALKTVYIDKYRASAGANVSGTQPWGIDHDDVVNNVVRIYWNGEEIQFQDHITKAKWQRTLNMDLSIELGDIQNVWTTDATYATHTNDKEVRADTGTYGPVIITENGTYYFGAINSDGLITYHEVVIDDIDKIAPTISSVPDYVNGKLVLTLNDNMKLANLSGTGIDSPITTFDNDKTATIDVPLLDGVKEYSFKVADAEGNEGLHTVKLPENNVTFDMQGHGTQVAAQKIVSGGKATEPAKPSASGFEFKGWYKEAAYSNLFDFATRISSDTTLYAKWEVAPTASYKVEHYKANLDGTYPAIATETDTPDPIGTIGQQGTATPKTYVGFTVDTSAVGYKDKGNIEGDGSLVLKIYYKRNTDTKYSVEHYKQNLDGTYPTTATEKDTPDPTGTTGETATATPKIYSGFTVDTSAVGYKATGTIEGDGSLVLKIYYKRNTDTPYKVEHLKQDLTGGSYTVANTDNKTGTTGDNVVINYRTYPGFTLSSVAEKKESFTIKGDGSLVIQVRYDRNKNTPYKVEHYIEKTEGGTYVLKDTENLTGTTGAKATAKPKTYVGYAENTAHKDRVATGEIAGDGSLVLKLYYKIKDPEPAGINPEITKTIKGSPEKDSTFKFKISASSGAPLPSGASGSSKIVSLKGAGTVKIGQIKFTETGTYKYTVTEINTGMDNYEYDISKYKMEVEVTKNTNETLQAKVTYTKGGDKKSALKFQNTYKKNSGEGDGEGDNNTSVGTGNGDGTGNGNNAISGSTGSGTGNGSGSGSGNSTQTGDNTNIMPYIIILVAAAVVICLILLLGRRRKKEEKK